jgi:hypothetical protein
LCIDFSRRRFLSKSRGKEEKAAQDRSSLLKSIYGVYGGMIQLGGEGKRTETGEGRRNGGGGSDGVGVGLPERGEGTVDVDVHPDEVACEG